MTTLVDIPIRVTATRHNAPINIRTGASTRSTVLDQVRAGQDLTLLGIVTGDPVEGLAHWVHVRYHDQDAYIHAAFFTFNSDDGIPLEYLVPIEETPVIQQPISGIRFGVHTNGWFDPQRLIDAGVGAVRLVAHYAHDPNTGQYGNASPASIQANTDHYLSLIDPLRHHDIDVILVLNHEFFGEGEGWDWTSMPDWTAYRERYITFLKTIWPGLAGRGLVAEIWNEQDASPQLPLPAWRSVPLPAEEYGLLLRDAAAALRHLDPTVRIISGGQVSGVADSVSYAQRWLSVVGPHKPDYLGIHPYTHGGPNDPLTPNRLLDSLRVHGRLGLPLAITEHGLDAGIRDDQLCAHIDGVADDIGAYNGDVGFSILYPVTDGMDGKSGLFRDHQTVKPAVADLFRRLNRQALTV